MESNETMSQDMGAVATQGTVTSPNVSATAATADDCHGKTQVDEPNEERKEEEVSTLSSSGVSAVQVPHTEGPTQWGLPPRVIRQ